MNDILSLKRPFIWLSRFRYRCGYGVHSPFAFSLITDVIYEELPYYDFQRLAAEQKAWIKAHGCKPEREKVNQLLFRLVNRAQPATVVEIGCPSASAPYLQAAKPTADYLFVSSQSELPLPSVTADLVYLNDYQQPALVEQAFGRWVDQATEKSLFIVKGIGYSRSMKALWKRLQNDERVGITFDLYDVGLLFFDRTKIKQHYTVNF